MVRVCSSTKFPSLSHRLPAFSGQYLSGIFAEKLQELKLCRCQHQRFSVLLAARFFKINLQVSTDKQFSADLRSSENRVDPLNHNLCIKWLGNIIIRAQLEAFQNVIVQITGC